MTYFIAALKEKHKFDICFVVHDGVPALEVVLVTREAVYEETELLLIFLHGLFHRLAKHTKQHEVFYSYSEIVSLAFPAQVKEDFALPLVS